MTISVSPERPTPLRHPDLDRQLADVAARCSQCGLCVRECPFLGRHGDPRTLAETCDPEDGDVLGRAFACNLCELCAAVCPHGVNPARMFLEMRREAFRRGMSDLPEHRGMRRYEQTGTSSRFSWYALPEHCDTIFFPGCALAGSRSEITLKTFATLQQGIPGLGIVLDCCTKPSHDLGDAAGFSAMFGELRDYLVSQGIRTVLVACPNCHKVFSDYGGTLATRTVYEVLAASGGEGAASRNDMVTLHDPCVSRFHTPVQQAVRQLLRRQGVVVAEMPHSQVKTLCCGEGGAVGCLDPEQARHWVDRRLAEADGRPVVSYCAACTHIYGAHTTSVHVLDLYFAGTEPLAQLKATRAPLTYWKRWQLKRHLRRHFPAAVTRERTLRHSKSGALWLKALVAVLLLLLLAGAHASGLNTSLNPERLQTFLHHYPVLAPLIYMAVYTVAPVLLIPGLPLTLVGGILFGPFWGVVYSLCSATAGACLAFLVSRYLARDLVKRRLTGPRWRQLDQQVAEHGWKVVALTRLIPLFPFNLLNYAFGLTSVKFSHYALATLVFMLPGCVAYIVFSSSLLDLLQLKISPAFLLGLGLVLAVSLLPVLYAKLRQRRVRANGIKLG